MKSSNSSFNFLTLILKHGIPRSNARTVISLIQISHLTQTTLPDFSFFTAATFNLLISVAQDCNIVKKSRNPSQRNSFKHSSIISHQNNSWWQQAILNEMQWFIFSEIGERLFMKQLLKSIKQLSKLFGKQWLTEISQCSNESKSTPVCQVSKWAKRSTLKTLWSRWWNLISRLWKLTLYFVRTSLKCSGK